MKLYYLAKSFASALLRKSTMGSRILLIRENKILLVKHTYMPGWYTIGGAVERGESPLQAIHRELAEEVGVTLTNEPKLFGVYLNTYRKQDDYVACYLSSEFHQSEVNSPEIAAKEWFDLNHLPPDTTPATLRRVEEFLGKRKISDMW